MTPEFERNLRKYMAARGIKTKSEAVRQAVEEGLARIPESTAMDWSSLRGKGLSSTPYRFDNNDQLWATACHLIRGTYRTLG